MATEVTLSADDFERSYAERSGMTVADLRALGAKPVPCDCDNDSCRGWRMDTSEVT